MSSSRTSPVMREASVSSETREADLKSDTATECSGHARAKTRKGNVHKALRAQPDPLQWVSHEHTER
ncbi:hypothetical protein GCM10027292_02850 [Hydrogenophaga aquatica]